MDLLYVESGLSVSSDVVEKVNDFIGAFRPFESSRSIPLCLYFDYKSKAYYVICHLSAETIVKKN